MVDTNKKDNFNINQKDKEAHIQRTVLNFSQVEIPKDFSDLFSKGLDYKVAKKRLPLLDIISGVEDATENISATYMKNSFRVECLNILKRGRSNDKINCNEKIYRKIWTWLKDNKSMVAEADKGRVTCRIEEEKVNKMMETELNNQNSYHSLRKGNIDNVRSKVNKKFKKPKESGSINEKLYKDLKPHTPKTPSAGTLLKIHKSSLKLDL